MSDVGHTQSSIITVLQADGVFKGAHGLEGLLNAETFWEEQPYGARIYYGEGIDEYLHHDVLSSAVKALARLTDTERQLQEAQERAEILEGLVEQSRQVIHMEQEICRELHAQRITRGDRLAEAQERCARLEGERIVDIQVIPWEPGQVGIAIKRANGYREAWPVEPKGEPVTIGHLEQKERCERLEGVLREVRCDYACVELHRSKVKQRLERIDAALSEPDEITEAMQEGKV